MLERLQKIFRPLVIFYFLVAYIFASFIWWSFLLSRKNIETFKKDVAILQLQYEKQGISADAVLSTPEYARLEKAKQRQRSMIGGEAVVFFILLSLGAFQIHRSFRREIELNRQQRNFILSITHELKSPLAGIKLSLETVINRVLGADKQKILLQNARKDTERLGMLVENILMAAKIENETITFTEEELEITALIKELVEHYKIKFEGKGSIHYFYDNRISILADPMAFNSIVSNLIENAIKYSEGEFNLEIRVKDLQNQLLLEVADTGVGIPDADKKKVFRKFYRVGQEETRRTKGTGLGLYLIKELVQIYKGKITVKDNQPKGTIIQVLIPMRKRKIAQKTPELKPA